jgi:hypothetical protein
MGTHTTSRARGNTRSNRRRKSTSLPIVTDCAAAIDQIINVVHQPAKLTFHRHRALLQRIYDLLEKRADRQQGPIELKVAAHSGDIGTVG